jgi:hypothetical protein
MSGQGLSLALKEEALVRGLGILRTCLNGVEVLGPVKHQISIENLTKIEDSESVRDVRLCRNFYTQCSHHGEGGL